MPQARVQRVYPVEMCLHKPQTKRIHVSVLIHKGFRYRIYPSDRQIAKLSRWESALRWLWNLAHEQRLYGLRASKKRYYTFYDQRKELTELRAVAPWIDAVPRNVCDQLLNDLDQAWQKCFNKTARVPHWKKQGRNTVNPCQPHPRAWRLGDSLLFFQKLGHVPVVVHRPLEGVRKSATIVREGDQWFVAIVCKIDIPDPTPRSEPTVAIDRGITWLFATSDGKLIGNPRPLQVSLRRLARAERTVSRRKKGSKNREKAKILVASIHRKVRRQRAHFLHVESSRLAKNHGTVVIEKLNVAGMIRGNLSRSIMDAGWSKFAGMLRYKLAWSGGTLIEVPAAYSSQTCSECGHVDATSRNQERFSCTGCGHADHADLNAAKILKSRANRSGLPVEGSVLEAARRSRKSVVLRVPRRRTPKDPA